MVQSHYSETGNGIKKKGQKEKRIRKSIGSIRENLMENPKLCTKVFCLFPYTKWGTYKITKTKRRRIEHKQ